MGGGYRGYHSHCHWSVVLTPSAALLIRDGPEHTERAGQAAPVRTSALETRLGVCDGGHMCDEQASNHQ